MTSLTLSVTSSLFAICRLDANEGIPPWAAGQPFSAQVVAGREFTLLVPQEVVPESVRAERDWRLVRLEGTFPFSAIGILSSVLGPLAAAGISILAYSGFETDFVLVKGDQLPEAVAALREAGHQVLEVHC